MNKARVGDNEFEAAAAGQVDVTPEIDEIGELLSKSGKGAAVPGADESWKHGYPYDEKMTRRQYEFRKRKLQIELIIGSPQTVYDDGEQPMDKFPAPLPR